MTEAANNVSHGEESVKMVFKTKPTRKSCVIMRAADTMSWRSSRRLSRIENTAFITRNMDASSRSLFVNEMYAFMAGFPVLVDPAIAHSKGPLCHSLGLPAIMRHQQ